jgi:hypothetical protein
MTPRVRALLINRNFAPGRKAQPSAVATGIRAAVLSPPGLKLFPDGDASHRQPGDRVKPLPTPQGVGHQPHQDRLLAGLDRVLDLAQRAGNDELLEWAALAALDPAESASSWACSSTWRRSGGGR